MLINSSTFRDNCYSVLQIDEDGMISLPVITQDNEKYRCFYKDDDKSTHLPKTAETYDGLSPKEILKEFATRTSCSYRV